MKSFPDSTRFKKPWRTYQERVLSDLEGKMQDKHLHIIAPPSSGKTVLGLEVMRRINRPSLVLAPTLAIRDQWAERFCDLFLEKDEDTSWISRDINNPGFLTVSTYQALHSAMSGNSEEDVITEEVIDSDDELPNAPEDNRADKLIESLLVLGVQTLVVDEAHHLRSKWWK